MSKKWRYLGAGGVLIVAAMVYYTLNPAYSPLFPRCPFFVWTGWKCPGCGSQRAIHSLLHGDVGAAWNYNALLVFSLPIVFGLLYAECIRTKRPRLYASIHRPVFIWIYFLLVVLWWVFRNYMGW